MIKRHFPGDPPFSRRDFLALAVGTGIAAATPNLSASAAVPVSSRAIPRSGERLPVIGLGTAIVFDIQEDPARLNERRAVIQAMADGGGSVIDTAPSYGAAESVVGDLLADTGIRARMFLATKVRATARAPSIAEMQQSLRRLRTDKLDLMQLHNVGSSASEAATQIGLLREWKEQGICRYVGITHYLDHAHERLVELMRREKPDFIQVNYSMADRGIEQQLLSVAKDTGTAVLVNLPFGRGKLFSAVRGKALPAWAAEFDAASWGQFFLKYILAQEAVTCVIPGTDKPEYMIDNLNAGRGRLPDAAMRKKMIEFLESPG